MEAMAREWTDDRLDVLNEKVTFGFKHVDERFAQVDRCFEEVDRRFEEIDKRFEQMDKRLERVDDSIQGVKTENFRRDMSVMQRQVTQGLIAVAGVMATGFVGLATLIGFSSL
jgi:archaellum component FlaC